MAREKATRARHDGVTRLVVAEREWQRRLDEERSSVAALIASAEEDARRREHEGEVRVEAIVAARRADHERLIETATRDAGAEREAIVCRHQDVAESFVDDLAAGRRPGTVVCV